MNVLVFTTVYPNEMQKNFGVFVHERMRHVAKLCNVRVLAPIPISTKARIARRESYSRVAYGTETMDGIPVYRCPFFYIPGIFKFLDGYLLYLSSLKKIRRIRNEYAFEMIDAHFAYPDGFAAVLLGKKFKVPVTITLRGTIMRLAYYPIRKHLTRFALDSAERIFSVSSYLKDVASSLGIKESKFKVIPNGINLERFATLDKRECRELLGIGLERRVMVSVGALSERKGHHRIVEIIPEIKKEYPEILYIIVGGASVEGDMGKYIARQIKRTGIEENVLMVGEIPHERVGTYLYASDLFVLPTKAEGWANVFVEALACGLPVVTTDVCGNSEVITDGVNGMLFKIGEKNMMIKAILKAFSIDWNREAIAMKARERSWDVVAIDVYNEFAKVKKRYR